MARLPPNRRAKASTNKSSEDRAAQLATASVYNSFLLAVIRLPQPTLVRNRANQVTKRSANEPPHRLKKPPSRISPTLRYCCRSCQHSYKQNYKDAVFKSEYYSVN